MIETDQQILERLKGRFEVNMAVLKDYDYQVARLNNLPDYDDVRPSSYQKKKYADTPMNSHNSPQQAPDTDFFFEDFYIKDHRERYK